MPDHRAVAAARIDEDQRGMAGRARHAADVRRIDLVALETLDADSRRVVFAKRADVLGFPAEPGAADRGAGTLPSWQGGETLDPRFPSRDGMVRNDGDDIEAVEAEGDDVEGAVRREGRK
jgi:hypothetical protein